MKKVLVLACTVLMAVVVAASPLKVSFAVVDITPPLGIYLNGYGRPERLATGVHSPLKASIMVLSNEKTAAAVIGLDWCNIDEKITQIIRKEIQKQTGISEKNILLCCSHTHSAPITIYMKTLGRTSVDPEGKGIKYTLQCVPKIAEGVKQAKANLTECTAGFAAAKTFANVNRRGTDENGVVRGFIEDPDQICDHNLTVVHFLDAKTGKSLGIFVHMGCHNTAMGVSRLISSDWCGVMRSRINDIYKVPVIYVNGALGDVGPRTNRYMDSAWSGKGYSAGGGDGVKAAEEVGSRAAFDALRALETIKEFRRDLPFAVSVAEVYMPQTLAMSKAEAEAVLKKYDGKQKKAAKERIRCQIAESVLESVKQPPQPELRFEQTIIAFGPVALVPFPFEMFSIFSLRLRRFGPYQYNLLCSNTNGRYTYLPDRGSFAMGGYEPECLPNQRPYVIAPDAGDKAISQTLKSLRNLNNITQK